MKKKARNAIIVIILLILLCVIAFFYLKVENDEELKSIKSIKQLQKIYEGKNYEKEDVEEALINVATMPFSALVGNWDRHYYTNACGNIGVDTNFAEGTTEKSITPSTFLGTTGEDSTTSSSTSETKLKDYSTTNVQVENVDEADITKTDGDYIYSISGNDVVITNVINPKEIKIETKIYEIGVPEDLILYKDKLVIISAENVNSKTYYNSYSYNSNTNTTVKIYDISQKDEPKLVKSYQLNEPYYTSRCIDNRLYVIAAGRLRGKDNEVDTSYYEDNVTKKLELDNIKYLKDIDTDKQTLFSMVDLNNVKADIDIKSYLIDISNAYVSENSIYLLNREYEYSKGRTPPVSSLFGIKGILGAFTYEGEEEYSSKCKTEIYKFDILKDGQVKYSTKTKTAGETINQYSLDEMNGHLRVALYDNNGARVAIFDEKLNQIGTSS